MSQPPPFSPQPSTPPSNLPPLQFLDVTDPVYGVDMGKLPFFAGWQGAASVMRNDAFSPESNSIGLQMVSPDRQAQITTYGPALHTCVNQIPGKGGHVAVTRFTSTGDLITRHLLPTLDLAGPHSAPRPSSPRHLAPVLEEIRHYPFGAEAVVQGAAVMVSQPGTGLDYVVDAITLAFFLGTPSESTITHFTLLHAPAAEADALASAWEALPPMVINPVWRQFNLKHTMEVLQRMQQQQLQLNAQMRQWMQSYNARQEAFNRTQTQIADLARDAQQHRADQSLSDAQQSQRNITDIGNRAIDAMNGDGRFYTFCNDHTGEVVYQYNNTAPPDASGQWRRCGSD